MQEPTVGYHQHSTIHITRLPEQEPTIQTWLRKIMGNIWNSNIAFFLLYLLFALVCHPMTKLENKVCIIYLTKRHSCEYFGSPSIQGSGSVCRVGYHLKIKTFKVTMFGNALLCIRLRHTSDITHHPPNDQVEKEHGIDCQGTPLKVRVRQ